MGVAVVVGVGPGLGSALAGRFAREGLAVALVARSAHHVVGLQREIAEQGGRARIVRADTSDAGAVAAAAARIRDELGPPTVLVYNAGTFFRSNVEDIEPEQMDRAWRVGCFGAFLWAREVIPAMKATGEGTVLFTGATASLRGSAGFAALAVGKFGLRALAQSLAREAGPAGIHVAHVIIDGLIDGPQAHAIAPDRDRDTFLDPERIAEVYWQLHRQHPSAWTHELDLRPAVERF